MGRFAFLDRVQIREKPDRVLPRRYHTVGGIGDSAADIPNSGYNNDTRRQVQRLTVWLDCTNHWQNDRRMGFLGRTN